MEHKTLTRTHHLTEASFLLTSNWTDAQSVFDCWIIHEANILNVLMFFLFQLQDGLHGAHSLLSWPCFTAVYINILAQLIQ